MMRLALATISSTCARKQRGSEITLLFRLPFPRKTLCLGNLCWCHLGSNGIPLGAPGMSPIAAVEAFPRLNGSNDRLILRGERHMRDIVKFTAVIAEGAEATRRMEAITMRLEDRVALIPKGFARISGLSRRDDPRPTRAPARVVVLFMVVSSH